MTVNDGRRDLDLTPVETLQQVLRTECGLESVRHGCQDGTCGECTVLLGGEAIRSCLMFAVQCAGAQIRTVGARGPGSCR